MPGRIEVLPRTSRITARLYSSSNGFKALSSVDSIACPLDAVNLDEFRQRAFIPATPTVIRITNGTDSSSVTTCSSRRSLPAAKKWFSHEPWHRTTGYLSQFRDTILPYELMIDGHKGPDLRRYIKWAQQDGNPGSQELATFLAQLLSQSDNRTFHRFNAPLSLFLQACRATPSSIIPPSLYIAQAQIADLPKQLQDDLPTPRIVKEAGKGDVYDANIWMGIPPTYTPLHKDPNPNLFVQLASSKLVRLFEPAIGSAIFRDVQQRIGQYGSASLRGDEMMEGQERDALDEVVWGNNVNGEGFETIVGPGDALFIPKGWWHSIKSVGSGVTASVNWWFR